MIFNRANLLYFLGFPGASALLVPTDGEATVYVYGVNYEQAKAEAKGFNVQSVSPDENLMAKITAQAKNYKIRNLVVDFLGVENWHNLAKQTMPEISLEVTNQFVQELRALKDPQEIAFMRKAGELTSEGMKVAYEVVKPGAKEYEVAAEIEYVMRRHGSGPLAFETIVASGYCSAFPHGGCSSKQIHEGDLVMVDIGATFNYYCSDMTRTLVAGKPSEKQQQIFDIVKTAQLAAFEVIASGTPMVEVDAAARKIIEHAGFKEYFVHGLGHGVGLEVHEWPSLNSTSKDALVVGNVVTDEPGVYIPSFGGVRIEDTILVQKDGAEKLTIGPYLLK